jgi:hypothetical protein
MRTLGVGLTAEVAADQAGWAEVYDFYLKEAITTPWGSLSTLRVTSFPGGMTFYTPNESPEPEGTRGDAQVYEFWPMKRKVVKANARFANDKLAIAASNVSGDWVGMLAAVDWYNVPVMIRKVSTTLASPTAADYVVVFSGQVDSCRVTLEQLQFVCSNNFGTFQTILPAENMHATCRFRVFDGMCSVPRLKETNLKHKTCTSGCTATKLVTTYAGYAGQAVTIGSGNKVELTSHTLQNGMRVRMAATSAPTGVTLGRWYYVVSKGTNDFQLSLTYGGAAVEMSGGTGVTITTETGLVEDTGSSGSYGTELVNGLADGAITASSYQVGYEPYRVKSGAAAGDHWRFGNTPSNPTPGVDIYSPYVAIDMGSSTTVAKWTVENAPAGDATRAAKRKVQVYWSSDSTSWNLISVAAATSQMPGQTDQFTQTVLHNPQAARYWRLVLTRGDGLPFTSAVCGKVKAYSATTSTTDLVNALSNGAISGSSEKTGNEAYYVKSGNTGYWGLDSNVVPEDLNKYDWGNCVQGYWQIPDAQAGLANAALKPYIQFDFGSAKRVKVWRLKALDGVERQDIPRLVLFFSSADASTWTHEGYFEVPPEAGKTSDVLLPEASSARYWRICVRTTWAEALSFTMFNKVEAYEGGRNYWQNGKVRFAADTATAALRGVARPVLASYAGEVTIEGLETVPAAGDRFTIERGCDRSFNGCCRLKNWENYGGFDSLPSETVIR